MKNSKLIHTLLPISALLLSVPITFTVVRAESTESAAAESKGDATKAMLKELDRQIDQLDQLEDNAPTREEKDAAKARIKVLKERRHELRKNYVQARYDELKSDVKNEYDRLSQWTKKTFSSNSGAKVERGASEANADAQAAANPAAVATTADIDAYKLNPTDQNKAEVKASLATLDDEIKRLEARIDDMPKSNERDSAKLRLKALKNRRSDLGSDFRQARYEALKADIKDEWNKLTS